MSGVVQREFTHSSATNRHSLSYGSQSVNGHYSEHASRLAKQVILISSKYFSPLSFFSSIAFQEPEGWKANASSHSIPGSRPRLEW